MVWGFYLLPLIYPSQSVADPSQRVTDPSPMLYIYGPVRKLREAGLDNFAKGMDLGYEFQGPGMVLNKNTVKKH